MAAELAEDKELGEWFERIWFKYPNELCHKKKGAKKPAEDAARKIFKRGGIAELERIERNLEALVRYDRKDIGKGEKVDRWPHLSTWLNQGYYDRETDAQTVQIQRESVACKCGQPAATGDVCARCYERNLGDKAQVPLSMLSARLRDIGLGRLPGETDGYWGRRCRDYAMKHFGSMMKLIGQKQAKAA